MKSIIDFIKESYEERPVWSDNFKPGSWVVCYCISDKNPDYYAVNCKTTEEFKELSGRVKDFGDYDWDWYFSKSKPRKDITEYYTNWKDFMNDITGGEFSR